MGARESFDDRPPSLTLHAYDSEVLAASRGMRGQGAYTPSRGKERGKLVEISEALLTCPFVCRLSASS